MQDNAAKVTTIGLDERSVQALQYAFENRCNKNCVITDVTQAQVGLIDLDKSDARVLLDTFRQQHANMPIIALCREKAEYDDIVYIYKPFSVTDLAESIITLAVTSGNKSMNNSNKITNEKIELAMKALDKKGVMDSLNKRVEQKREKSAVSRTIGKQSDDITFEQERFLLGEVIKADKEASKSGKTAILTCWGDKTVIINNISDRVITDLNDNQIRSLAITPFDGDLSHLASPITARFVDKTSNEILEFEKKDKVRNISKEVFLWNLGYLTCRGRIPADISLGDRVFIKRWPNLTRVTVPNNAMRIISYWIHQPGTLSELTEKLDIPMDDVFSVFTAAYAAGLAGVARRQADELLEVVDIQQHKKRNLFSSILGRLRKQDDTNAKKTA